MAIEGDSERAALLAGGREGGYGEAAGDEGGEGTRPALDSPASAMGSVREHWELCVLLATNTAMMDMNYMFLVFLLVQSDTGCDYMHQYAWAQTVTYFVMLAWRPLSGVLTDKFALYNHWLLLGASLLELLALASMMVFQLKVVSPHGFSSMSVLALSVGKTAVDVQIVNSTYKIFKMRLAWRCGLARENGADCLSQCRVITAVGIAGEFCELSYSLATSLLAYALLHTGFQFAVIKNIYLTSTLLVTVVCFAVSVMLFVRSESYYLPPRDQGADDSQAVTLLGSSSHGVQNTRPEPSLGQRAANYLRSGVKHTLGNRVVGGSLMHAALIFFGFTIMYSAESLDIPGRRVSKQPHTTANFCGSYLTNLVLQDTFDSGTYFLAVIFFIFVLRKASPRSFYGYWYPAMAVCLLAVASLLLFDIDQSILAVAFTLVVAFLNDCYLYDGFLGIAATESSSFGFFGFIKGYIETLANLASYLIVLQEVSSPIVLAICGILLAGSAGFGVWLSFWAKQELLGSSGIKSCA